MLWINSCSSYSVCLEVSILFSAIACTHVLYDASHMLLLAICKCPCLLA